MHAVNKLSDFELLSRTQSLASEERKITTEILWMLREVERRKLYAQHGMGSLFDFAVKVLRYSDAAAMRRINASRLLEELPEVAHAIEHGDLSLSNAATIQGFFKRELLQNGKVYTPEEKKQILNSVEHKSRRECEKVLIALSPSSALPQDTVRIVSKTKSEVRMTLAQEVLDKLHHVRGLLAHSHPNMSYSELIGYMAELTLERIDPVKKAERAELRNKRKEEKISTKGTESQVAHEQHPIHAITPEVQKKPSTQVTSPAKLVTCEMIESRRRNKQEVKKFTRSTIPAAIRHQVYLRDEGRCTFVDSNTQERCNSTFALQIDHKIPIALGGGSASEPDEFRLLCAVHNRWEAVRLIQHEIMSPSLSR